MARRRRARRPAYRALIGDGPAPPVAEGRISCATLRIRWNDEKGEIDPPISSIMVRNAGPVNWHGAVRDFRGVMGQSPPRATALFGP